MKPITIVVILLLSIVTFSGFSQNDLGKTDDAGRISLNPVVSDEITGMPAEAITFLKTKLQQCVALNGLGATGSNMRFLITANVTTTTKDILPGPPPKIAQNLEVTFFIVDYNEKKVFSSVLIAIKGVGTNETKAYIDAIKNIKPSSPDLKNFVEMGKMKIIEFYNSNCDFILEQGRSLASQKKFEEAITVYTSVPEVCKDCYIRALAGVGPVYQQYIDNNCRLLLNNAKSAWIGNQNADGAAKAGSSLAQIDPQAQCYPEAAQLMGQIEKKVLADENREWNFKMKKHDDGVEMEKIRIQAYKEVGLSYGTHLQGLNYRFAGWLW
ncbi:MAG: hypothetical protein WCO44_14570 [Bacteroidota bacterium]